MGRESQIDEVAARLKTARLVTLSGAGGIGKTRLALQVARRLRSDGAACAWIALSSTVDQFGLTRAVFEALFGGKPVGFSHVDGLAAAIGQQELLLVLDNCEQIVGACADLVLRLLEECSGLRILATGREQLGVPGEVVYPVPPLRVDRPHGASASVPTEAVRLFFERAQALVPTLRLTRESEALARQICVACEGLPLAIELAGACTGSMTLAEIADRLQDTLRLLTFGPRAAPARQQSARASIDWSHRLLSVREQLLLRRLSVFETDFSLADVEWVCAFDGLQAIEIGYLLNRLVAQSLVRASRHGSTTRYSLWRTVRQYGLERLVHANELVRVRARAAECRDAGSGPPVAMAAAPDVLSRPALQVKRSSRRPEVLSEREHAVVQLIAGGRSNREIADELVITRKTAEAHVSHILTKLGLCSRVQIATWSLLQSVEHGH